MAFAVNLFQQALQAANTKVDLKESAKRILSLIDLTSLNLDDDEKKITALCEQAITKHGNVAAVCIFPQFISLAKTQLKNTSIKIATVVNFPNGVSPVEDVTHQIEMAIKDGADEIDVVWPYKDFLAGHQSSAKKLVHASSVACANHVHLKVILETGLFPDAESIYTASQLIIDAGADFIKTSTGKVEVNATLEAAAAMLLAIKDSGQSVGFKAAGGIRTTQQAAAYLSIADHVMGDTWAAPDTFRFGASALLGDVLKGLG